MIVSASYRTDIPAFYAEWFLRRLDAGYCRAANPYGGQIYRVPLDRPAVDGFVFWTRNPGPFLGALEIVRARGYPFVVHYTVTGYPRALEASVPAPGAAVDRLRALAERYGRRAVVWRYDPILLTSATGPDWHEANFARLAAAVAGATDEVVVSFAHIYRKTQANLARAACAHGFAWRDPDWSEKRALLARLVQIAADFGLLVSVCAQPDALCTGAEPARCIDAVRLSEVAGRPVDAKPRGNRPGCACAASRDIGAYDTCPHGCVYCYAVRTRARAQSRLRGHDPASEML